MIRAQLSGTDEIEIQDKAYALITRTQPIDDLANADASNIDYPGTNNGLSQSASIWLTHEGGSDGLPRGSSCPLKTVEVVPGGVG